MADNVQAEAVVSPGATFATDDDGAAHHPYVKLEWGADNTFTKVASGASAIPIQDGGNSITIDNADITAIKTAVEIIDNVVAGSEAQVDIVSAGPVALESGGNLDAIKTAVELIDNAIAGSEMQVDIVTMPAVDTELTTADLDTGAGTDTRAVVGLVGSASGGGQLIPGNATDGLLVNLGTNNDVTVTGSVTANAGTNLNTSALALETTLGAVKTAVELIDNAISGTEMQVDVVAALPAGTNHIGQVGHGKTLKSVTGAVSTTTTIISAVGGKKIKVYRISLLIISATAVTVTLKSGAAGTALATYPLQSPASVTAGITESVSVPSQLFETAQGALLELSLSAAVSVTYNVSYWDDDAT